MAELVRDAQWRIYNFPLWDSAMRLRQRNLKEISQSFCCFVYEFFFNNNNPSFSFKSILIVMVTDGHPKSHLREN